MNKASKPLLFFVMFFALLALPLTTRGATSTDFNPNFIISDEEMQDYLSMNRADIQSFLENYPGTLSSLKTPDKDGQNRLASDIIYQASLDYKINPKYVLVKLQKEQSLITDATPTQKQLDGATGYGITDGCGWTCDSYLNNQGFGKQVDSAAGIMRWYYDHVNDAGFIKKPNNQYSIDGTTVQPLTFATAFLYTYTPHLHGNLNFWNLWQKWFEQVYPDGTVLKGANSSTVYLIQDGKKRPFQSMSALISRYDPKMIVLAPDSELARYADDTPITLPNYSILKSNNNYYLLDNETIRPFSSYDAVIKMGYQPEEIIEVADADLVSFEVGQSLGPTTTKPLGQVVKVKENNALYFIKDNVYHLINDEKMVKINFPNLSIDKIAITELGNLISGEPVNYKDGTLIGIKSYGSIYVMEKGLKRHIADEDVFNGLGYNWDNIIWVDNFTAESLTNGQPIYLRAGMSTSTPGISDNDAVVSTNSKMVITPAEKVKYVGTKFDTSVDTYLVADYKTGKILAGKNIDTVRPMASFAKVMTGYELMKEGLKLFRYSTYNEKTDKSTYHQFRIINGERIKNDDLMKSMLVSSINTAAKILANQTVGGEKSFVKRMNAQAKTWGLKNTVFVDSYGYDLGNLTTARDYLKIFDTGVTNQTIAQYLELKSYEYTEVLDKDGKPKHFDANSNLLVKQPDLGFNILASKTGYLDEAGAGLAMLVQRPKDKKKFIVITMGNPDYANRFDEPQRLTEWAMLSF